MAVSIGSAPLAPATLKKLQDKMPQASVINSYGLTEAGPAFITMTGAEAPKHVGSVGKPNPPMEVRIVDPDTDADMPARDVGELLVRLPGKHREYYKDESASAAAWTDDGWLRTGDVANIDPEGYVQLADRAKDLIKSGGEWISSVDLENALAAHPAVREAGVIAVAHPKWDERPLAVVVLRAEASVSAGELREFLSSRFAKWQLPDAFVFVDELPHTSTGKLSKLELRKRFAAWKWEPVNQS